MPILNKLHKLAENTKYDPVAPTWCIVNHLLLTFAGEETTLGAVVAASGECAIWSYDPHSFGPMYFSIIGGDKDFDKFAVTVFKAFEQIIRKKLMILL